MSAMESAMESAGKPQVAAGQELEDWRPIRAYWAAMAPEQVVGFAGEGRCCPLAKWLRDVLGAANPWVGEDGYAMCLPVYTPYATAAQLAQAAEAWARRTSDHPLPDWAAIFISYIDQLIPPDSHARPDRAVPVRAGLAIRMLDQAVETARRAKVDATNPQVMPAVM